MKANTAPACTLQVLLARRAPMGLVFRRGPSKWVQLIKWNTKTDEFEPGQWFHGHIYVNRSDLSPDGDLLLYFASKFTKKTLSDREYTYAWTAISKPPYLTALALWPKGDCWHGGGLFRSTREVLLNHRPAVAKPHPSHKPPRSLRVAPNPEAAGEDDPVFIPRMERDGWKFVQWLEFDYHTLRTVKPSIMEKSSRDGLTLRVEKYCDPWVPEQWLCSVVSEKAERLIGTGSWADFDQQGGLVFAEHGRLFRCQIEEDEVVKREIANFTGARATPLKAPRWATIW